MVQAQWASPLACKTSPQNLPPPPRTGGGETLSGCRPLGPSARFQDVGHKQRGRLSAERERRGIPESTSRLKRAGPAPVAAGGWSPTLPPALRRIAPTENPRSRHLPSTSPTPAQRKPPGEEERAGVAPRCRGTSHVLLSPRRPRRPAEREEGRAKTRAAPQVCTGFRLGGKNPPWASDTGRVSDANQLRAF